MNGASRQNDFSFLGEEDQTVRGFSSSPSVVQTIEEGPGIVSSALDGQDVAMASNSNDSADDVGVKRCSLSVRESGESEEGRNLGVDKRKASGEDIGEARGVSGRSRGFEVKVSIGAQTRWLVKYCSVSE